MPELQEPISRVAEHHQKDLEAECDGVFLFDALELNYRRAANELICQWLFPAHNLTQVKESKKLKRYHILPSLVQKAIRTAVQQTKILK